VELLPEPERDGPAERDEAARRIGEVGLEDAVEFLERLVVEADVREIGRADPRLREAVGDGLLGKGVVVTNAGEAFLLGGGHDLAVPDQGGRAVVVEGGDAEDVPLLAPRHGATAKPMRTAIVPRPPMSRDEPTSENRKDIFAPRVGRQDYSRRGPLSRPEGAGRDIGKRPCRTACRGA